MTTAPIPPNAVVEFDRYVRGWAAGTGLPVSLEPGHYRITYYEVVDGGALFILGTGHRVHSDSVPTAASSEYGHGCEPAKEQ